MSCHHYRPEKTLKHLGVVMFEITKNSSNNEIKLLQKNIL